MIRCSLEYRRFGAGCAALVSLLMTGVCHARTHVRRHFEPTDLEFERSGTTELDLETGFFRSDDTWRLVAPDFELDLGLTNWLELGVDGAFSIEGAPGRPFSFDHVAPDPLWPALKLGLLGAIDDEGRSYAIGAQVGPKLATAAMHGVGFEGLLLAGAHAGRSDALLNFGGFTDPAPDGGSRPIGFETSLAWSQDLDASGTYSLNCGLSAVVFTSADTAQLQATFGPTYSASEWLDVSVTALVGFLSGGDRFGVSLGVAPHLPIWKTK